jgi:hypothetical protein
MKTTLLILFIAIPSILFSQKKITSLEVKRTGCKGTCPVYEYQLNSSGIIIYTGIRFVGNVGKYKINVGQKNVSKIFKKLERNDFENAEDMYDLKQSDISMLFYKINLKSGEKNIGRANFGPKYLQETFNDIDNIVKKYSWTKINE